MLPPIGEPSCVDRYRKDHLWQVHGVRLPNGLLQGPSPLGVTSEVTGGGQDQVGGARGQEFEGCPKTRASCVEVVLLFEGERFFGGGVGIFVGGGVQDRRTVVSCFGGELLYVVSRPFSGEDHPSGLGGNMVQRSSANAFDVEQDSAAYGMKRVGRGVLGGRGWP